MEKENKMGTMPVNKLLLSMSLPMVISMLVMAFYNIVDSYFVSQIQSDVISSKEALSAVSLAFPLQSLMIAVAVGTGVGVNALLSKSLGEKNMKNVKLVANNGIFLAVVSMFVFVIVGLLFTENFMLLQTENITVVNAGSDYLKICCICSIGLFLQVMSDRLLMSTGKTIYTMITQAIGAIVNIVLDPCFIFGLGFFPKLGVSGAGVATVIGQIVGATVGLIMNVKMNKEIQLSLKGFKPNAEIIGKVYAIGIPSIIVQAIGSVMTFCINRILLPFGDTAQAVFGVYFKIQSIVYMPVFGLNNGMVPIISYNYGAMKRKRMVKTIKLGCIYAFAIMLLGLAIMQIFPEQILNIFSDGSSASSLTEVGVPALKTISLSFIFAGISVVFTSTFQALGNAVLSMIISIARQLGILIPAAYLLAKTNVLENVWYAFPLAEIVAFIVSVAFMIYVNKKVIRNIKDND